MEESFARVEKKYRLSLPQTAELEKGLFRHGFRRMAFGSPRVQSIYYDTPDYQLIRTSLECPVYKEKLRLRAYGEPGAITMSFVEIKKKYKGVVYKRRATASLLEAAEGLRKGSLPESAGQVGREAAWMGRRYGLIPTAVIAYDREAWFSEKEPDIRVTFDRNIGFRAAGFDLNVQVETLPCFEKENRLVEIKTCGVYPLWLVRLIQETGAERIHFTKYGFAYQKYISGPQRGERGEKRNV